LITPLFSLEEMEDCRSTITRFGRKVTSEDVEEWFSKAGDLARMVLKLSSDGLTLKDWVQRVRTKIYQAELSTLCHMIAGLQFGTFALRSDDLFHWHVAATNVPLVNNGCSLEKKALRRFKRKMVRFALGWVVQQFFLHLRLQNILNTVSLILNYRGDVETSVGRGYWFQEISHMILSFWGQVCM
jgi:hypothetical protein